jgi:DNA-binding NarL/FixJ family response regulator
MPMSMIRVMVVDDSEPWREFVLSSLRPAKTLRVVYEASDGLEAVLKAEELKPDLILLDIGLPSLNGIEAARRILLRASQSKILFMSQESDPEVVQAALSAGGRGYIVKSHAGSEMLAAIEAVVRGEQYLSQGLAEASEIRDTQPPGTTVSLMEEGND